MVRNPAYPKIERDDGMLRRFACLFLSIAVLCPAAPAFAEGERVYSDIEGHWAQEVIERWTSRGIVEGYGGEFRPDEILTRAQMAKILSVRTGLLTSPWFGLPQTRRWRRSHRRASSRRGKSAAP